MSWLHFPADEKQSQLALFFLVLVKCKKGILHLRLTATICLEILSTTDSLPNVCLPSFLIMEKKMINLHFSWLNGLSCRILSCLTCPVGIRAGLSVQRWCCVSTKDNRQNSVYYNLVSTELRVPLWYSIREENTTSSRSILNLSQNSLRCAV